MNWDVQITPSANRTLDRLPRRIAMAVIEFVASTLMGNPERMSTPLSGELEGLRLARRGDCRVLFLPPLRPLSLLWLSRSLTAPVSTARAERRGPRFPVTFRMFSAPGQCVRFIKLIGALVRRWTNQLGTGCT